MNLTGATCREHPDQAAAIACARCGSFACDLCAHEHEGRSFCERCFEPKSSKRAVTSLLLALVGLNCMMPFLGIPAIILAQQELEAIERGESPAKGRSLAKGARILGWIEVGILGLALIIGVLSIVWWR
ncbi:MAG: DUF4190 domain-containing protein [Myxococcaceae bacterium]